jgi:hypothetical protein
VAFGPLQLRHDELWNLSLGELLDLIDGYRYRDWLESRRLMTAAVLIANCSGNLRHPLSVEDLVGRWVDGQIMDEDAFGEYCKDLARRHRAERLRQQGVE